MKFNKEKGLTLIEVLVAISLITTVVFAPLSIISNFFTQNALNRQTVQAKLLAQEVIEFIRYDRDNSFLAATEETSWFDNLDSQSSYYKNCLISVQEYHNGSISGNRSGSKYCNIKAYTVDGNGIESFNNDFIKKPDSPPPPPPLTSGTTGSTNSKTCDGNNAKDNGKFTATLTMSRSERTSQSKFVIINSCVSWKDRSNEIRKIEFEETLFEWLKTSL